MDQQHLTAPDKDALERIRAARKAVLDEIGAKTLDPGIDTAMTSCGQWTHFDNG